MNQKATSSSLKDLPKLKQEDLSAIYQTLKRQIMDVLHMEPLEIKSKLEDRFSSEKEILLFLIHASKNEKEEKLDFSCEAIKELRSEKNEKRKSELCSKITAEMKKISQQYAALTVETEYLRRQLALLAENNEEQGERPSGMQKMEKENQVLRQIKDELEKHVNEIQSELEMIYKFTNLDEEKVKVIGKKIEAEKVPAKKIVRIKSEEILDIQGDYNEEGRLEKISEEEEEDEPEKSRKTLNENENNFEIELIEAGKDKQKICSSNFFTTEEEILKLDMRESLSMSSSHSNSSGSSENIELEKVDTLNSSHQLSQIKDMIAKKRANHSIRAPSLLYKLDENRNISEKYQTQLEEEKAELKKEITNLKEKYETQIKELNEKIDQLMKNIEENEEERIRNSRIIEESSQLNQSTNGHNISDLTNMLTKNKDLLIEKSNEIMNLQDEINELKEEYKKVSKEKHYLNEEINECLSCEKQLKEKLDQASQSELKSLRMVEKLSEDIQQLKLDNQKLYQMNIIKEKALASLESQMEQKNENQRGYLDIISQEKEKNRKNEQKIDQIMKQLKQKDERLQKVECDMMILKKKNDDLKYLSETLRKDALKVKQINEFEPSNSYSSQILKKTGLFQKEKRENIPNEGLKRMKSNSYVIQKQNEYRVKSNSFYHQKESFDPSSTLSSNRNNIHLDSSFKRGKQTAKFFTERQCKNSSAYSDILKKKYMI